MVDYIRDLRQAKWDSMINLNGPYPLWILAISNSGRALALPATDAAVLGTCALYGCQLHAR